MRLPPRVAIVGFVLLAFAMFAWMFPFTYATPTIGKDYTMFGPLAQVNLMWSAHQGTFPLYMPGFAGGHSTAAMTLGQLYHPISWLSSVMPRYGDGQSLEWTTLFRLVSLGLAQLALYQLCRRLRLSPIVAFFVTFPAVYNLRMLDSFRYGPPIDAYAAMLLACAAAGFLWLSAFSCSRGPAFGWRAAFSCSRGPAFGWRAAFSCSRGPALGWHAAFLAFSTYLLAASGHPQWAFLGLLITGIFALAIPWIAAALDPVLPPPKAPELKLYVGLLTLCFGSGLLLAAPYLLTFYFEFLKVNVSRVARDYEWTLAYTDSVGGVLASFVLPFRGDVHTAFGGSVSPLIAALLPLAAVAKRPPRVLWVLYAVLVFAILYALGAQTPVHAAVVKHVPFFGSFRVPGRITLWMPVVAFPIVAWVLQAGPRALAAVGAGGIVLCVVNVVARALARPLREVRSPHMLHLHDMPPGLEWLLFALFVVTLLGLAVAIVRDGRPAMTLATVALVAGTWITLFDGTWKVPKHPLQTYEEIATLRQKTVRANINAGYGMESTAWDAYKTRKIPTPRPLCSVAHDVRVAASDEEVLETLKHYDLAHPLFLDHTTVGMPTASEPGVDVCELRYNTANRHVFDVTLGGDAYLVLTVPWLPGFRVEVDGVAQELARGDALYPAVFVPSGHHTVDFRFVSWPFMVGAVLSFTTLWCWVVALVRRRRALVGVAGVLLAAGLAAVLNHALYHGPSFGTRFRYPAVVAPEPKPEPERPQPEPDHPEP